MSHENVHTYRALERLISSKKDERERVNVIARLLMTSMLSTRGIMNFGLFYS